MESSTIKPQIEFENLVNNNLIYGKISKMSFEQYKEFVFYFFTEVDKFKKKGLRKDDVKDHVMKNYSDVMSTFDDDDILFERRFEVFNEELIEFCSSPFFWSTNLETYFKKWNRRFDIDWYKNV